MSKLRFYSILHLPGQGMLNISSPCWMRAADFEAENIAEVTIDGFRRKVHYDFHHTQKPYKVDEMRKRYAYAYMVLQYDTTTLLKGNPLSDDVALAGAPAVVMGQRDCTTVRFSHPDLYRTECLPWMEENCKGWNEIISDRVTMEADPSFDRSHYFALFELERDAVLFKLTWCGR